MSRSPNRSVSPKRSPRSPPAYRAPEIEEEEEDVPANPDITFERHNSPRSPPLRRSVAPRSRSRSPPRRRSVSPRSRSRSPLRRSPVERLGYKDLTTLPLQDFPIDVLRLIMADLSFEDAARLCGTNEKLRATCQRHDLVNRKKREYIAEQCPLVQSVFTPVDQFDLIKKGFRSWYFYSTAFETVQFYGSQSGSDEGVKFGILGLPPASGVEVLILYHRGSDGELPIDVYMSIEDMNSLIDDYFEMPKEPSLSRVFGELLARLREQTIREIQYGEDVPDYPAKMAASAKFAKDYLWSMLESDDHDENFILKAIQLP